MKKGYYYNPNTNGGRILEDNPHYKKRVLMVNKFPLVLLNGGSNKNMLFSSMERMKEILKAYEFIGELE